MVLLVRTTPIEKVAKNRCLSMFLVDLREAIGNGLEVRPIRIMMNQHTSELFFDGLEIPVENLIGEEGHGFRYILDGMNMERIAVAAESIGDGYWFVDRAKAYSKTALSSTGRLA
jgi:acyl-CoA dehydrogenase